MKWIIDNKEWIFSGIGVLVLSVFVQQWFPSKHVQKQKSGRGSINYQAGKDININK
jgi:hypothetical protein